MMMDLEYRQLAQQGLQRWDEYRAVRQKYQD
jgi:hypothetical protein